MSLAGRTILITRQREQSSELVAEIEKRGGCAIVIPMISISEPQSWAACDAALARLSTYHAVVFTSTNGVGGFFRRGDDRNADLASLSRIDLFAVGRKTGEEIEKRRLRVRHIPETFSSDALSEYFRETDVAGRKFLLVRGNLGREEIEHELVKLGAEVDPVEVYRNAPPDLSSTRELQECFRGRGCEVVTFASPSAVRNFAAIVSPTELQGARVAVIGPTTREAAAASGFRIDIEAKEFTGKGLIAAIDEYFQTH
jgi:uroporphyrinogen III methyltransferase/synthase